MANQPKKYKKFVASAATATLVASAIVPVASAATPSDIAGNDHEQNIKDLLELGYVSGKADGTFAPNEAVTRGQVVLMLGKWAEAQGIEVPADYLEKEYFNDYPSYLTDDNKKYYALVKAAGIFEGYEDGSLKPAQNLSRVQLAVVLNSAYEAVTGKSLVDLAGDTSDVVLGDIDAIYAPYQPAVLAMKKLGITAPANFNPTGTVTRGQFASFLNATIKAEAPAGAEAGAIKSLTATGVSELTVEFDGVVDTEAAEFALTRGSSTYTVSDVDWNENNTSAVLTVDTKFVDATYTLTVTGISEEAVTATVTTTREVATSLQFLSNALVLNGVEEPAGNVTGEPNSKVAKIAYEVYNQYGEDITKTLIDSNFEVKVKGIDENAAKVEKSGIVTVWVDEDEDEDTEGTIELTYKDGDLELEVEQDVYLTEDAEPGYAEIVGVYNENNRAFTTANVEKYWNTQNREDFYVLFEVKDQFGVKVDAELASGVSTPNTNLSNVTSEDKAVIENVRDGLRFDVSNDDIFDITDEDEIFVKNVDGKYYFAVPLKFDIRDGYVREAGENTVTIKAKATGEETSKAISLEDSAKISKIQFLNPEEAVAGLEVTKVPVVVYDQSGEEYTDVAKLNDKLGSDIIIKQDSMIDSTYKQSFVEENGKIYFEFKTVTNTSDEAKELDLQVEVDSTGEEHELTINVQPNAFARTIVGLSKEADQYLYNATTEDTSIALSLEDLVIEDQYGRVIDDLDNIGFDVQVKLLTEGKMRLYDKNDSLVASGGFATLTTANDEIKLELPAANDGNATVEFKLVEVNTNGKSQGNPVESKFSATFRSVDEDDFESYNVKVSDLVFSRPTGVGVTTTFSTAEVEVFGVLSNGTEVELSPKAFAIIPKSDLTLTGTDLNFIKPSKLPSTFTEAGTQTLETGFEVVLNQTGERFAQKVTISEASPKIVSLSTKEKDSISGKELTTLELTSTQYGDDEITATEIISQLLAEAKVEAKDQYGNKYKEDAEYSSPKGYFDGTTAIQNLLDDSNESATITVTFSDVETAVDDFEIIGNGKDTALIKEDFSNGDTFNVTLKVDDVTKTFKVRLK